MKNKKGYFELNIKNIVLALGIVLSTALSIIASLLLGEFLDFIVEKPSFDEETGVYLLAILVALLVSTGCNIILGQWLPLKLELRKSIEYSQDVMDGTLNTSQKNFQKHEKGYYINLVTNSCFHIR